MNRRIYLRNPGSWYGVMLGLVAVLIGTSLLVLPARGQAFLSQNTLAESTDRDPVVGVPVVAWVPLSRLTTMDLSVMPPAWWEEQRTEHLRLLKAGTLKGQVMQNIVFFSTYYPEHVDFREASSKLLKIYRSDQSEGYRIMALAALAALGQESTMAKLYEHVQQEKSERVRRVTLLALGDYYKTRAQER